MKLRLLLVSTLSVFLLSGYGSDEKKIRMPFAQTEVFEALLLRLDKSGIPYQKVDKNTIDVAKADYKKVFSLAKAIAEELLPPNNSVSLAKNLHQLVMQELSGEGLPFNEKCFDGTMWLIWDKKYVAKIEPIIKKVETSISPDKYGGLNVCL